jgi:beta-1,4-N-acetylglucosaminyltransferase
MAIFEVEELRTRMRQWPPIRSGEDKYKRGLAGVMDEEMGWVD